MKRLIITLVIIAITLSVAFAAVDDIVIELRIPVGDLATFRAGFLRQNPVPQQEVLDEDGKPTGEKENMFTDLQWFKIRVLNYINGEYEAGQEKLKAEAGEIKRNIVQ